MKTKNTMTRRFFHQYNELDAVAEFLEKQAAEGWELTNITGSNYGFRRAEPRKVKINAEIVSAEADEQQKREFIELCDAAGWKHIYDGGVVQYFQHESPDAEPIHTDPEVKLKVVHEKSVGTNFFAPLGVAALCLFWWMVTYFGMDYVDYMSSQKLIVCYGMPLMVLLLLGQAAAYRIWYRKARSTAARGESPVYRRIFFLSSVKRRVSFTFCC